MSNIPYGPPPAVIQNAAAISLLAAQDSMTWRRRFMTSLDPDNRDLDRECGYPDQLEIGHYRRMFDRNGLGRRAVQAMPEECWSVDPEIFDSEDPSETEFEKAWKALNKSHNLLAYMARVDEQCGIGSYGCLLFGLDDGEDLEEPVEGFPEDGEPSVKGDNELKKGTTERELLYIRVLAEDQAEISEYEINRNNRRFGLPTFYSVRLTDAKQPSNGSSAQPRDDLPKVHWTRILHVADNVQSSEVIGRPRMEPIFNRLLDLRKIMGGSGEMFYKGGFPGYAFEVDPDVTQIDFDPKKMREEFEAYSNGLQRYLAVMGVTAKSLTVQVADPTAHFECHVKEICIALGVPWRVFVGTEHGKEAGNQDSKKWNSRVARRQTRWINTQIITPLIERLVRYGVLPLPAELLIDWPDLNSPSDIEKADAALKFTQALSAYVSGGVDQAMVLTDWFTRILGLTQTEAEAIVEAVTDYQEEVADEQAAALDDAVAKGLALPPAPPTPPGLPPGSKSIPAGPPPPAKPKKPAA